MDPLVILFNNEHIEELERIVKLTQGTFVKKILEALKAELPQGGTYVAEVSRTTYLFTIIELEQKLKRSILIDRLLELGYLQDEYFGQGLRNFKSEQNRLTGMFSRGGH